MTKTKRLVLVIVLMLWVAPACVGFQVVPGVTVDANYDSEPASETSGLNLGVNVDACGLFGKVALPGFLGTALSLATGAFCS